MCVCDSPVSVTHQGACEHACLRLSCVCHTQALCIQLPPNGRAHSRRRLTGVCAPGTTR